MATDILHHVDAAMQITINYAVYAIPLRSISMICLLILTTKTEWNSQFPAWAVVFFRVMILWALVTILRGIIDARTYWDWKYFCMDNLFAFLTPYAIIAGTLFAYTKQLFKIIVTKIYVYGYLIIPLTVKFDIQRELYPRGVVNTIGFFVLIIPFVKTKWRLVIAAVALVSVFIALDFRSNVMRVVFSTLIVCVFYARKYITLNMLKLACFVLLATPIVFFVLGITNQFNVFSPSDSMDYSIEYENGLESNLAQDTRTFLYEEVLLSMKAKGTFLLGEGGIAKYKSNYFDDSGNNTQQRYGAEVGVLNLLLFTGIVGVIFHLLIVCSAVYYGIARSNNFFCKMLALLVAFKWVMFFIEEYTEFDMNFYFFWLTIGLCLSKSFRMLSDSDICRYFDFSKKNTGPFQTA